MDIIRTIAVSISSSSLSWISSLVGLKADSMLMKLHKNLISGDFETDEEAIATLYGNDIKGKEKFYRLKYDYKKRLLNTVFLVELKEKKGTNERKQAFFVCTRAWLTGNFLIQIGARSFGITHIETHLEKMKKYEFTNLIIESCRLLRQHYAVIKGDTNQSNRYHEIILDQLNIYTAELKAEAYYYFLMSHYVENKSTKSFVYKLAAEYTQVLNLAPPKTPSSSLIYKTNMIEIIKHLSIYEYEKAATICSKTVLSLKKKKFIDKSGLATIYYQWIICCAQMKQYPKAKELAKEVVAYTDEGSFNWFKGMEVLTQMSLTVKAYDDAYNYYLRVVANNSYKKMPNVVKEEWLIYEAYLRFLVATGHLKDSFGVIPKVKIGKFINDVTIFSKDKSGMNIPIIICYLVSLLHLNKYNLLIDQAESYEKYITRYLKKEEHKRTAYFIKMIFMIAKRNPGYHANIQVLYDSMSKRSVDRFNVNHIMEIIPYEDLWKIVLEIVKRQK